MLRTYLPDQRSSPCNSTGYAFSESMPDDDTKMDSFARIHNHISPSVWIVPVCLRRKRLCLKSKHPTLHSEHRKNFSRLLINLAAKAPSSHSHVGAANDREIKGTKMENSLPSIRRPT